MNWTDVTLHPTTSGLISFPLTDASFFPSTDKYCIAVSYRSIHGLCSGHWWCWSSWPWSRCPAVHSLGCWGSWWKWMMAKALDFLQRSSCCTAGHLVKVPAAVARTDVCPGAPLLCCPARLLYADIPCQTCHWAASSFLLSVAWSPCLLLPPKLHTYREAHTKKLFKTLRSEIFFKNKKKSVRKV